MPKQKSSRAACKRFKVTGSGKIKHLRANKSHILTKKHPKRKRRLRHATIAAPENTRRLRTLIQA